MHRYRSFLLIVIVFFLVEGVDSAGHSLIPGLASNAHYARCRETLASSSQLSSFEQLFGRPSTTNEVLAIDPAIIEPVALYSLLDLDLATSLQTSNPYDPHALDLEVSFCAPSGKEVQVGAFWFQGFDPQTRQPVGEPGWKVRFTPDETGEWIAVAYAPALGLRSASINFSVRSSNSPGFVRVNPTSPRYLAFDNGDFFFPIGVNMAWADAGHDPLAQYRRWLRAFTANGGNTIRVWMADWSFGLEWNDTGLGNYDNRQYNAWLLDQLFNLADKSGVKIILVLLNHGAFSLDANTEWEDNPYNAAQGGPLTRPEQFVSDPQARAYFKQKMGYIINRWGYSPDLLAWEWFNEVNLTPISDAALTRWLKEMTAYLDSRDVNHHLTTTSFAERSQSSVWKLAGLDIIQTHEYSSQINSSEHDLADRVTMDFQTLADSAPRKPILLGEFGYSAINYADNAEQTGIHLHNGIWATALSGYAGSGMYWWWDIYIDPNNLWHHFKGLASFLDGENLARYQPLAPLQINGPAGDNAPAIGLCLQGDKTLVWLRSDAYTVQASLSASLGTAGSRRYVPPLIEGLTLTLTNMTEGSYTVRWFDPQAARWLEQQSITTQDGTLQIPIPSFRDDLTAKISRNP